jgi:hypothetical protein
VTVLNQQLAELRAQLQASAGPAAPQQADLGGLQPGAARGSGYNSSSGQQASSQVSGGGGDGHGSGLTHVDSSGRATMVDVSAKVATAREARASCRVLVGEQAFHLVQASLCRAVFCVGRSKQHSGRNSAAEAHAEDLTPELLHPRLRHPNRSRTA